MFKKVVVCLMLTTLSAQASMDYTATEKFTMESAINILKDADEQQIDEANLPGFLTNYEVSQDVQTLVTSYREQGLTSEDFKKLSYGEYAIKKNEKNTTRAGNLSAGYPYQYKNSQCDPRITSTAPSCIARRGWTCIEISNGVCY